MGKISARTGMALTVAALATSGLTLLSGGTAQAGTSHDNVARCNYQVIARSGLNVRKGPGTQFHVITALPWGTRIWADCTQTNHFVKIWSPVTFYGKHIRGGWVARAFLKLLSKPSGGVESGGGGTSREASPLLPATGLGLIALGSGVAVTARRRRTTGAVPSA